MIVSLLYAILALLGLSVLIFIHELGHYFMARRVGMRVETFAIGFGKPIYVWEWHGVKWQVCWLLFGGYVKIAGQELEEDKDPYEVKDGFFGKPPIDRIKVALAGPIANLLLALVIFAVIWLGGGRNKNFSEFTHKIGWVDPQSALYADGVRPGDEIIAYNHQSYSNSKDHLQAPLLGGSSLVVQGYKIDYNSGEKHPFEYTVKPYPHPDSYSDELVTSGILSSASYLIYGLPKGQDALTMLMGSPMQQSGIQPGDRLVWVDGELIFSNQQLSNLVNDGKVLLTILRQGQYKQLRIPRFHIQDLRIDQQIKGELSDWQYEAGLTHLKLPKLYFIPYNVTNDNIVEDKIRLIDAEEIKGTLALDKAEESLLLPGDKIVAIDGKGVRTAYELLSRLQQHRVNIIVERDSAHFSKNLSWSKADADFDSHLDMQALQQIARSIGTPHLVKEVGPYILLAPVIPRKRLDFKFAPERQAELTALFQAQKKEIGKIEDAQKKAYALSMWHKQEKLLMLGIPSLEDRTVNYNPNPWTQFVLVFSEIWHTLIALVTGTLNPKWMSGPIGILQVVHDNWILGIKDALYWLGAISVNLGIFNLLPIPVLDGGTILLCLVEMTTGKRLSMKTLEKIVVPFAVLLAIFFIFLTYQDILRLLSRFF